MFTKREKRKFSSNEISSRKTCNKKKKKKLTKTFQKQKELQESRSNQLPGFKLVFLDPFLNSP